jgi:hypothetical protein
LRTSRDGLGRSNTTSQEEAVIDKDGAWATCIKTRYDAH